MVCLMVIITWITVVILELIHECWKLRGGSGRVVGHREARDHNNNNKKKNKNNNIDNDNKSDI